ncbi:regulator of chromosome condensation-like isoform X2 [Prorops nasuta]|uniref:regulator of chromosome condensation-like isoform X2 n=1 Tax=Prorops nasuta TaxID=863751 RepID=UPI0034CFF9F2
MKMPPRKRKQALKRTVSNSSVSSSGSKKRKVEEIKVKPNLQQTTIPGLVLTFGQGDVGQLGLGEDVMEKMKPAIVSQLTDIIAIAAGGALGRDTSKEGSETEPGLVEIPGKAIQVTAGDSHSAALLEDGRVFAWGSFRDSHGNMGLTIKGNERSPVEITPNAKIVKIASGADHLVLLSENGHVYTCGCAEQGQLGRKGSRNNSRYGRLGLASLLVPELAQFKITKKLKFSDIWAGTYCTFAKEYFNGSIYVFGLNNYFQIGLEEETTHFHPRISETFSGTEWKHISSGLHHTLALDEKGQVFVLGRKEYGRLGLGSNCTDAKQLTLIPALSSIKCIDIAAGSAQSFAVTETGELYAWGMGSSGQLGTGSEDDVDSPVLIKGKDLKGKSVVKVAGGGQHTIIMAVTQTV